MGSATGPKVPFSELPLNTTTPDAWFNAWGLYGEDDEKGFLNRVTDEMVAKAAKEEIITGKRINLSLPLDFMGQTTMFGRKPFHQQIISKAPRIVHDDVWTFNSQCSSQWDGLRHYGYQKAQRFYNNVSAEQIVNPGIQASSALAVNPVADPNFLGVHNLAERGIVGRGILLDFARWRDAQLSSTNPTISGEELEELKAFNPFKSCAIRHHWLMSILEHQNVTPQYGDILFLRSGYLKYYFSTTQPDREAMYSVMPTPACGIEQCVETLEWIWNNFSAVAGDQPAFEASPFPAALSQVAKQSAEGTGPPWTYHEVLLAGWGCPIGELFDLEGLGEECEKKKRYTFFVVSEVCNVPGGIASPPNILAIF